jgi:hypothetical protein
MVLPPQRENLGFMLLLGFMKGHSTVLLALDSSTETQEIERFMSKPTKHD